MGGGIVTQIEIMVATAGTDALVLWRNGNAPDERMGGIVCDELLHVVDVGPGGVHGREQQRPPIGMLVHEHVVKSAGRLRLPNPTDFANRGRVRQPGHIQHVGTQVRIRAARVELERLHVIVPAAQLEVLVVHGPQTPMQIGIGDLPGVEYGRVGRILQADDRGAGAVGGALHAAEVDIRPRKFLLDFDVRDGERAAQRQV